MVKSERRTPGALSFATASHAVDAPAGVPRYEHIFLIIEENRSYVEIIGEQSIAPNINRLVPTTSASRCC